MIKINIQILNHTGEELLDTRMAFNSLDELGLKDTLAYELSEQAKSNELAGDEIEDLTTDDEMAFGSSLIREI